MSPALIAFFDLLFWIGLFVGLFFVIRRVQAKRKERENSED